MSGNPYVQKSICAEICVSANLFVWKYICPEIHMSGNTLFTLQEILFKTVIMDFQLILGKKGKTKIMWRNSNIRDNYDFLFSMTLLSQETAVVE